MGKSLIIKGADFSENAIDREGWYNSVINLQNGDVSSSIQALVATLDFVESDLINKPINVVKCYSNKEGTITIGIGELLVDDEENVVLNEIESEEYGVVQGLNTIFLRNTIVLSSNSHSIFFKNTNKIMYYRNDDTQGGIPFVLSDRPYNQRRYLLAQLGHFYIG